MSWWPRRADPADGRHARRLGTDESAVRTARTPLRPDQRLVINPRSGSTPSPGRSRRPRNDQRLMIHPRYAETPHRGRRARPRNDQGRAAPTFAWSCRRDRFPIFLRDPSPRHDHERSGWRAVPGRRRSRSQPGGCLAGCHPVRVDPVRMEVAGLCSLPSPVVAWAAVPDVGARPSTTRPSLPGAHATILWSGAAAAGRPQASCLAPHRTCCTQAREARRASPNAPTSSAVLEPDPGSTAARAAHSRSRWGSTPVAGPTCPAHLRPTDARASRNRANPTNSRPQSDNRRARPPRAKGHARGAAWQSGPQAHAPRLGPRTPSTSSSASAEAVRARTRGA
jgi:hypothetical protein